MSLVFITCHNEKIEDIEKRLEESSPETIKRMYACVFSKNRRAHKELSKNQQKQADGKIHINASKKYEHKTFGVAPDAFDRTAQCKFLRKNGGVRWLREAQHECIVGPKLQPLPHFKKEKPIEKPQINIIERNIECIKKARAKKPPPFYVDTPKGDRHELVNSGLVPQYICAKKFTRVPRFVKNFKAEFEKLRADCLAAEEQRKQRCLRLGAENERLLTDAERKELLAGLEYNFVELTRQYQSMSLLADTLAKQLRKGRIERALTDLEKDIKLLKEHPNIYILHNK